MRPPETVQPRENGPCPSIAATFLPVPLHSASPVAAPAIVRAQEPRVKIRLGLVRLISSGPIFIAEARKFFDKVNLDVELVYFADGALAMPALVAGELDLTATTLNAGLFNTVRQRRTFQADPRSRHRTAGIRINDHRRQQRHGRGGLYDGRQDGAMLKGKRIAIQAPGSIDQYLLGREAQKAGLDPRTDLNWSSGMPYPDIVKAMGAGQADAANIPVPLAFLVENNKFGKIVGPGSDIEPNAQLACWVMSSVFLTRTGRPRFALHGCTPMRRACSPRRPPKRIRTIVKIISDATKVPATLIEAAAPRWTWYHRRRNAEHRFGCMAQGKFLSDDHAAGQRQRHAGDAVRPCACQRGRRAARRPNPFP